MVLGKADAVSDASGENSSLDVDAKTDQLLNDHPAAAASRAVIEQTLREDSADAGVRPRRASRQIVVKKEDHEPPADVASDLPTTSKPRVWKPLQLLAPTKSNTAKPRIARKARFEVHNGQGAIPLGDRRLVGSLPIPDEIRRLVALPVSAQVA